MILVDTNVWSEATKAVPNPRVADWLMAHRSAMWLSMIVIAEIRAGIEDPKAGPKRSMLEAWLTRLETANAARTLPFDRAAAQSLGTLLAARPPEARMLDLVLAAQALSRDCPIATRNVRDFAGTGVQLIDPWTA